MTGFLCHRFGWENSHGCLGLPSAMPTWALTSGPAVAQSPGPSALGMCGLAVDTAGPTQAILPARWGSLAPLGSFGYDSG